MDYVSEIHLITKHSTLHSEGRAYSTILNHVRVLKRLFVEAAPAIFVEGEHTFAGDGRPHPVVDTGGVATALPLATKEQLRAFLHRYHDVLETTARALPGRAGTGSLGALRQLTAFALDDMPTGVRRRTAISKAAAAAAAATTAPRRHPDLWSRLVSPRLEGQFQDMQRYRHRSEEAIVATLQTLPRLFARIPLEPYEEAVLLLSPFRTTEELRRFLRRHYFDMVDVAVAAGEDELEGVGVGVDTAAATTGAAAAEEAMAELWLFALIDRPDAVEWAERWKRHLEEVDAAAAMEAGRLAGEWEAIAARALGEVELAEERQRVLGELVAWAQRVKEGRKNGGAVAAGAAGGGRGGQPALDAEEGGPGAVDALEGMVEAVREIQHEEEGEMKKKGGNKGFGRPVNTNGHGHTKGNGNSGQPPEGKRGGGAAKKGFRRPWRRGNGNGNGSGK